MKQRISACVLGLLLFVACNKKESGEGVAAKAAVEAIKIAVPNCTKEIITDQPVKVGETGIVLPVKTKLCFSADNLEIRIELPAGFAFMAKGLNKTLPYYGTYACNCSASGTACQVFYASNLGFGCLQSTCSGSCTGSFTYKGYTLDRVVSTENKEAFFNLPEVQKEITAIKADGPYSKQEVYGVSFFLVNDETKFAPVASCDCNGTAACTMKKIKIPLGPTIYWCQGSCNGCELTV